MLGFQSLIITLFAGLVLLFNQDHPQVAYPYVHGQEATITTNSQKGTAIIESGLHFYQIFDSSQNSKLPFARFFESQGHFMAHAHRSALLYYSIGNAIDLELTSTMIIFPFHCFT